MAEFGIRQVTGGLLCACLLFATVSAQDVPLLKRVYPLEAGEANAAFLLNTELRIELMAAEPNVADPVALDFDEFGRAFVVEMRGYSEAGAAGLGRVRLLEDADHNGTFEKSSIYAEGMRNPTALISAFGGVIVGDAPELLFLRDGDGDGRADQREVLFDGFGTTNIQQLLNNLQWGMDGKLYGASGGNPGVVKRVVEKWPFSSQDVAAPIGAALSLRGQDFVIDLQRGTIEATTGGGQFGHTLDAWGNRFVCSNSDHCQQIVIDDRYFARNALMRAEVPRTSIAVEGPAAEIFRSSPVEAWRVARTEMRIQGLAKGPIEGGGRASGYFSGATGICYYDGDALPESYRGNLFVGDAGSNLVHRKRLAGESVPLGASRRETNSEFLASTDNWFRPVQIANAPDGSLIVLDMYREVVEHPASLPEPIKRQLDLSSGNDRGRIYRINTAEHSSLARELPGDANSIEELVEFLGHPNGWHRRTAARLLRERNDPLAIEPLRIWAKRTHSDLGRVQAWYLLDAWEALSDEELVAGLADRNPLARTHALKLSERRQNEFFDGLRLKLLADPDQRVKLQAILATGVNRSEETAAHLARVAYESTGNRWLQSAVYSSLAMWRGAVLEAYVRLIAGNYRAADVAFLSELGRQIVLSRDNTDGLRFGQWNAQMLESRPGMAATVWREATGGEPARIRMVNGWVASATAGRIEDFAQQLIERSVRIARDPTLATAERLGAIPLLSALQSEALIPLWKELFAAEQPAEIRLAALDLAAQVGAAEFGQEVIRQLNELTPTLRTRAVEMLVAREKYAGMLLEGIESQAVPLTFLSPVDRQRLLAVVAEQLRPRVSKVLDSSGGVNRGELIEQMKRAVAGLSGDRLAGREVFRKACASCHRLESEGAEVGPSLIGYAFRTRDDLLLHVLDPNREVDPRYLGYSVQLVDGRVLLGVLVGENSASVNLRTATGESLTLNRDEIELIRSTSKSLMPENLVDDLSPQKLADLHAYFRSLRN